MIHFIILFVDKLIIYHFWLVFHPVGHTITIAKTTAKIKPG